MALPCGEDSLANTSSAKGASPHRVTRCPRDRRMPLPAAVKRINEQGVAYRPAPVHSGLVDTRPARDGLHAQAVVALFAQLGESGIQDGVPYPGAPATQSRAP